ncbi:hypothetical protein [Klebsiella aerogenes]|uniref:hypothetical protein n=1 Tax=Klebsiella aerogenes TaxID=548 RepID=UPI002B1BE361|nr:hypothetical protein [Klebsiella aerogenes]
MTNKSTITREQVQKIIVAADDVITALAGTNEDVHPDDSKKMCELWDDLNDRYAPPVVVMELARMALAAMDSEPLGWCLPGMAPAFTADKEKAEYWMSRGWDVLPFYSHAQPAPVVPPEYVAAVSTPSNLGYEAGWNACRAAMLQAGSDEIGSWSNGKNTPFITAITPAAPDKQLTDDVLDEIIAGAKTSMEQYLALSLKAERAAMLQVEPVTTANKLGNSPVIGIDLASDPDRSVEVRYVAPPGYVMVPKEPTEDMIVAGFESEPDEDFSEPEVWEEYQDMSGCQQAAHRAKLCWAAMLEAVPPAPTQENI